MVRILYRAILLLFDIEDCSALELSIQKIPPLRGDTSRDD